MCVAVLGVQTAGILGLAYSSLYVGTGLPFFDDLVRQTLVPNVFAYAACSNLDRGGLWLGGYDETAAASAVQYVPVVQKDFYWVPFAGIRLYSGQLLAAPSGIARIDSGTTGLLLEPGLFNEIASQGPITGNLRFVFDTVEVSRESMGRLRSMLMNRACQVSVPVGKLGVVEEGQQTTIGLAVMQGSLFVFDRVANQVGIAPLASWVCASGMWLGRAGARCV